MQSRQSTGGNGKHIVCVETGDDRCALRLNDPAFIYFFELFCFFASVFFFYEKVHCVQRYATTLSLSLSLVIASIIRACSIVFEGVGGGHP